MCVLHTVYGIGLNTTAQLRSSPCISIHFQYCRTDTDRHCRSTVRTFVRTVILANGPLFAVNDSFISYGPSSLLRARYLRLTVRRSEYRACISSSHKGQVSSKCKRSVRSVRSVIIAYGPSFTIDGPYVSVKQVTYTNENTGKLSDVCCTRTKSEAKTNQV